MFKKLLIANRGEIALRIIRACAELGVRSVAIYTDADRYALHVKRADEAYHVGPESLAGYLNIHRIVNIAKAAGCDAIHPGYGFLSENAKFPEVCAEAGIAYIGPSSRVINTMGDKVAARQAMAAANIPLVPGTDSHVASLDEALEIAADMGYPIMLKASAGGGGRGLRVCETPESLKNNYQRVQSEAKLAFGDTHVYIEKYFKNTRHIEVQILADKTGNVVHLYERDCSIQRRHQKLIEVAPSPQISDAQRESVCQLAVKAAQAVNYENAGTVEFLLDEQGDFYFLEMNTRLQVEHPITEAITGIDIVQEQIQIAAGLPLSVSQENITKRGYAIEFRINAEDPQHDFLPSFGKITKYYAPGGPGVRTDSAIYTGYTIPHDYDSLCAKLTVWALDWQACLKRSERALQEMRMHGVKTTISYYLAILQSEAFVKHNFNTQFVEENMHLTDYSNRMLSHHRASVIAAAIAAHMGA